LITKVVVPPGEVRRQLAADGLTAAGHGYDAAAAIPEATNRTANKMDLTAISVTQSLPTGW
jgi:hypothetical protein